MAPAPGKQYRGSADAVLQNLETVEKSRAENVLIVSGDLVYQMDYSRLIRHHVDSQAHVTMGVPVYKIHQVSFGSAKPIAENDSKEGREKNRAVVLTVLVPKASGAATTRNPNQ